MPKPESAPEHAEELRIARLQAFAEKLAEKRKKAIEARQQSGIEREWQEDEEAYNGIDDANRDEENQPTTLKGVSPSAPLTTEKKKPSSKSTVFLNITQTYVDMAAASVADMLLPTDDMPFGLLPTPEPDIEAATGDPTVMSANGVQMSAGEIAKKMLEEAADSAEKAQTRIWDWLTESQWHAEARKLINQAARIGTSILKGPFPTKKRVKRIDRDPATGAVKITMVEKIQPTSKQIDPANFYPDPACGENIHNGSFTWERDDITGRGLRDLMGMRDADGIPMYLDSEIEAVLREGPTKKYDKSGRPADQGAIDAENYEIWYFTGTADHEDMAAAGCKCPEGAAIPVVVTVVNDRVIKATISTMDSGSFPYDVLRWQKVPGRWAGRSEARKVRTPQRMLNGATRALSNNQGLAAGPQLVIDTTSIEPADGNWEMTPLKVWKKKASATIAEVQKAIFSIKIDSMEPGLMNYIKFALEMADKCATMPIQQQGQQGVQAETAEGRRLLQNNASVQKRALAKIFDDDITEPHIGRYYEYLLLYGDDPTMKRDLVIDARGSTALFERDAQNIAILAMAPLLDDPEFEISKPRWIVEAFKAQKLDPKRFQLTDQEKAERKKQMEKNPPVDAKLQVAQVRANADLKKAQITETSDMAELRLKAANAMSEIEHREREAEKQRAHDREMRTMDYQIELMKFAQQRGIGLDRAKVELTKVAMQLRTQKELSANNAKGPQVAKPAVEPRGRAKPGKAFTQ